MLQKFTFSSRGIGTLIVAFLVDLKKVIFNAFNSVRIE
jgi:hypothetical protein